MGIDAESTDLTARTRAARRIALASGAIDPVTMRSDHGVPLDLARIDGLAKAAEAREARQPKVYDMEFLPGEEGYEGALAPEDGGDTADADSTAPLPEEVFDLSDEPPPGAMGDPSPGDPDGSSVFVDPAQSDAVLAEVLDRQEEMGKALIILADELLARGDGMATALVLIAQELAAIRLAVDPPPSPSSSAPPTPAPSPLSRLVRWLRTPR